MGWFPNISPQRTQRTQRKNENNRRKMTQFKLLLSLLTSLCSLCPLWFNFPSIRHLVRDEPAGVPRDELSSSRMPMPQAQPLTTQLPMTG